MSFTHCEIKTLYSSEGKKIGELKRRFKRLITIIITIDSFKLRGGRKPGTATGKTHKRY